MRVVLGIFGSAAFPMSASHGMRRWELDPSALTIRAMEACGLAWDVQRVTAERQRGRAVGPPAG